MTERGGAEIALEGVEFAYRGSDFRLRVPALRIAAGERVAFVGPSGSGKTTLLHLMSGIAAPERGRVMVGGTDVGALTEAGRRALRARQVGFVFQSFELVEYLTVRENILLPCAMGAGIRRDAAAKARAAELAEGMGLGGRLRRNVLKLSHGEKQRVAICRALLARPRLLLCDEPTGNLDPAGKRRILELLCAQAEEAGATLVMVTHDHGLLEAFGRVEDVGAWEGF